MRVAPLLGDALQVGPRGRTRSTLDLGGPGWALLVAGDPRSWAWAANGVPLPVHRLDADFLPGGTALLLRPDDIVAWRGTDVAAPHRVLRELLHPTSG